jgi:hypothetical protein
MVSPGGDDWLVVTPDGLFDGTPAAWSEVLWRLSPNLLDALPVEVFFNEYFYPNLLGEILSGKRPRAPAELREKDRRQPQVRLALLNSDASKPVTDRTVKVQVNISAVAGARDVRLFRNGMLVKTWAGDVLPQRATSIALETDVSLIAGENHLTAYAFNRDNVKSGDDTLTVTGDVKMLTRKGILRILSIGVGRYANRSFDLSYTPDDARTFASEITKHQQALDAYERVEPVVLIDDQATKANILDALKKIATDAKPEDAVIIYFSGHGTAFGTQRFYLIPHDLGYRGLRCKLDEKGLAQLLAHSISDEDLEALVRNIDVGQLLLIIDACKSGQALNAEDRRRGPMNTRGLAQLAYEKGMYVLTASQDVEEAFVSMELKHSYLTYALVEEALKTRVADKRPEDGKVWLREWYDFTVQRVPGLRGQKMQGKDIKEEGGEDCGPSGTRRTRTQTPRAFYPREPSYLRPFVIARVTGG